MNDMFNELTLTCGKRCFNFWMFSNPLHRHGYQYKASRPKSHNASSKRTWIDISNSGSVISIEAIIEVTNFNTITE